MTEPPDDQDASDLLRRRVTIQNEKTKLSATALNTIAVTVFAGGVVLSIIALSFPLTTAPPVGLATNLMLGVWALVAAELHWTARVILNRLR